MLAIYTKADVKIESSAAPTANLHLRLSARRANRPAFDTGSDSVGPAFGQQESEISWNGMPESLRMKGNRRLRQILQ